MVGADPVAKGNTHPTPFVDIRFKQALIKHGCVGGQTGWQPVHELDAPAYLKHHSHGEFVFDWMWARAAQRASISWYPKLLIAAPFSPVTGERLGLTNRQPDAMAQTLTDIEAFCHARRLSNAGINFCAPADREILDKSRWLHRFDWQFHWQNRDYETFDDFLGQLKRKPRKNIRAERKKPIDQGWTFKWIDGNEASNDQLALAHQCYSITHHRYGNHPALSLEFFIDVSRAFGDQFLLCVASQEDQDLACAIFFRDDTRLYGRYWGSLIETRDLHFETCYYQGIEYCIAEGLEWFEPGAQGEHKIKRGFMPHKTHSYHWFALPQLYQGISDYLKQEKRALLDYRAELETLNPYKDSNAHANP